MTLNRQMQLSTWSDVDGRPPFDPLSTFTSLATDYTIDAKSCVLDGGEISHVAIVDNPGSATQPSLCQILSLRAAGDAPAAFSPGAPLTSLAPPNGYFAAEVRYAALWPTGTVAHLGSSAAPGLSQLSFYLRQHRASHVTFRNLYDPSVFSRISEMDGQLRSIDFTVDTDKMSEPESRGVFGNLWPQVFGIRVPRITISVGMGRRAPRRSYLDPDLQDDAVRLAETASDHVERMIIKGRNRQTDRMDTVNLLRERITENVELPAHEAGSSLPDGGAAYAALLDFYRRSGDVIGRATRIAP